MTWRKHRARTRERNNFDLQMRLTRRIPSVSLPPCRAKISGSTPEAEEKELRQRGEEEKGGKREKSAASVQQ